MATHPVGHHRSLAIDADATVQGDPPELLTRKQLGESRCMPRGGPGHHRESPRTGVARKNARVVMLTDGKADAATDGKGSRV